MTVSSFPITPNTPTFLEVLKDIANKEPTSSPRTLRTMAGKLSLSGRKRSSRQKKEMAVLGDIEEKAPLKLSTMVEEAAELSETSGSISRRRGFRPLSIHTGKAFDPFALGGSPRPDQMKTRRSSNGPEMIEADFATLVSCTRRPPMFSQHSYDINKFIAPNIIDHPVFQSDPFSATSLNPLLKATSSPLQIRESRGRTSPDCKSSGVSSAEWKRSSGSSKNKFLFDSGLKAPNDGNGPGADLLDLMLGGSPLPRTRLSAKPLNSLSYDLIQNSETRKSTSSNVNAAPVSATGRST